MKIEELSIGNYVKVNYGLGEGQIFKVESIFDNKEGGWVDLHNKEMDENYSLGHSVKELDPVYIKNVIDKLDFEKKTDGGFDYYQIFSDYYADIRMEEFESGLGLYLIKATVINDEFKFPSEIFITSQLHDLQNFLTKTQINIKIEL